MDFWDEIEAWIYENGNYLLNIDIKRAIFGIVSSSVCNKPINYILILTRYYIYKCRISNNQLNLRAWINEVNKFLKIEKMIAMKKDGYEKFIKHWNKLLILFETS